MTYLHLVKRLTDIGSDAPSHEAAEIIRVISGKSREWCLANRDTELPPSVSDALAKREQGIPLQYILGEAWFYGNRFSVSPDCLIPQPDTEHCVAIALSNLNNGSLLDLCTGSGCIAISILKENTTAHGVAVDISAAALELAKRNSIDNGTDDRLSFIETDVLSDNIITLVSDADVIVSNPPYINTDVIDTLSTEVQHEPRIALDGGVDGMIFYSHFIKNLTKHMKPSAVMILEIGYDQAERITELCNNENLTCRLHRDFGGNIRVAEIRVNPSRSE
ncbi:MAG: peptide chain release factor N(5)-glutamine methyltransferase [Clostridia bacterium]|nr:peptide chain release factor N(5)-glutamine methyltransferase [Clostridia bacterium]